MLGNEINPHQGEKAKKGPQEGVWSLACATGVIGYIVAVIVETSADKLIFMVAALLISAIGLVLGISAMRRGNKTNKTCGTVAVVVLVCSLMFLLIPSLISTKHR